jgi:hypothetical protein
MGERSVVVEAAAADIGADETTMVPVRGDMSAVLAFREGVFRARRYLGRPVEQPAGDEVHAAPHIGAAMLVSPDGYAGPPDAA